MNEGAVKPALRGTKSPDEALKGLLVAAVTAKGVVETSIYGLDGSLQLEASVELPVD